MATISNQIPSPRLSAENEQHAAAISEQENVHLSGFITVSDSGSESSLHGSNSGCITPAKRRAGTRKSDPSKKLKRTQSSKKSLFARKWELEDEIVVLKEMWAMKQANGLVDAISLYNSLKGKLKGDYSMDQLKNKIRNTRTKYVMRGGDFAGLDANSHEALVFGLSEKIWGKVVMKKTRARNAVENGNGVENENVDDGKKDEGRNFVRNYKRLCKSTIKLMKKNVDLIGKVNDNGLDDEWKTLWMEEMELNHKEAGLRMEQIGFVYDHIKK